MNTSFITPPNVRYKRCKSAVGCAQKISIISCRTIRPTTSATVYTQVCRRWVLIFRKAAGLLIWRKKATLIQHQCKSCWKIGKATSRVRDLTSTGHGLDNED